MKAVVTYKGGLNVREKKTKNADVVRVMACGEEFEFEAKNAGWLKLADGWCMAEFAEELPDAPAEDGEPAEGDAEPEA